ncbi:MAG TPA: glycosyltransferase [Aggregatilineales bacterium]|nr:glycosyltransferase [Aggregatilineales bacterium]
MPESQPNEPQQPKRRLRILISILYYVPHYTGYTIHVRDVAEALAARGHEVTVLCARHSLDLPRDETINGVRIVRLWAPIRLSRGMIMPLYPLALLAFMRKVDLIFANSPRAVLERDHLALGSETSSDHPPWRFDFAARDQKPPYSRADLHPL